jgi:hypothetical protein
LQRSAAEHGRCVGLALSVLTRVRPQVVADELTATFSAEDAKAPWPGEVCTAALHVLPLSATESASFYAHLVPSGRCDALIYSVAVDGAVAVHAAALPGPPAPSPPAARARAPLRTAVPDGSVQLTAVHSLRVPPDTLTAQFVELGAPPPCLALAAAGRGHLTLLLDRGETLYAFDAVRPPVV